MDYDELVLRLRDWVELDSYESRIAADALVQLQARVAELKSANSSLASESICHMDRNDPHFCPKAPCDYCLQYQRQRAERAEADLATARALLSVAGSRMRIARREHDWLEISNMEQRILAALS